MCFIIIVIIYIAQVTKNHLIISLIEFINPLLMVLNFHILLIGSWNKLCTKSKDKKISKQIK